MLCYVMSSVSVSLYLHVQGSIIYHWPLETQAGQKLVALCIVACLPKSESSGGEREKDDTRIY